MLKHFFSSKTVFVSRKQVVAPWVWLLPVRSKERTACHFRVMLP